MAATALIKVFIFISFSECGAIKSNSGLPWAPKYAALLPRVRVSLLPGGFPDEATYVALRAFINPDFWIG
jgi:hypothetical protein